MGVGASGWWCPPHLGKSDKLLMEWKMYKFQSKLSALFLSMIFMLCASNVSAAEKTDDSMAAHKLVLQISDDNPGTQTKVLNVANNMRKAFGHSDIEIEIVAFNQGLKLLFENGKNKDRLDGLALGGVNFTACSNTIAGMTKKLGHAPVLHESAISLKKPGVQRIMELVEQGYTLIRP